MTPEERRAFLLAPIRVGWFGQTRIGSAGGSWAGCQKSADSPAHEDAWDNLSGRFGASRQGKQARRRPNGE